MHRKARTIGGMWGSGGSFEFLGATGVAAREAPGRQEADA